MTYHVRSASLNNYVELARSLNLAPYRLLQEAGIGSVALLDPDLMIPADALARLLEASAAQAGIDDFGLRLAATRQLSNLGPLALIVREEPTLRHALDLVARYQRLHNEALLMRVEEGDGIVVIAEDIIGGQSGPVRQGIELTIGVLYRMLRLLLGPAWRPQRICFTHRAPARRGAHQRFFEAPVEFSCDFDGIVCKVRDLDLPMPMADPQMAKYVKQYLAAILGPDAADVHGKVRQLVGILLPSGLCSAERVAQNLGVDRRTVHRHLKERGETFSSLVHAVRLELVTRHIEHGQRPLADIALLLGFSSPSAFARWFSGHYGCSVTAWRARPRPASPARPG